MLRYHHRLKISSYNFSSTAMNFVPPTYGEEISFSIIWLLIPAIWLLCFITHNYCNYNSCALVPNKRFEIYKCQLNFFEIVWPHFRTTIILSIRQSYQRTFCYENSLRRTSKDGQEFFKSIYFFVLIDNSDFGRIQIKLVQI